MHQSLIRLNVKGMTICTRTYFEPLRFEDLYYKRINKKTHTYIHKLIYNHRNNTHNIYNIFCTYQNNPIVEVQLIYWIYVDKNRILKQVTCLFQRNLKKKIYILYTPTL